MNKIALLLVAVLVGRVVAMASRPAVPNEHIGSRMGAAVVMALAVLPKLDALPPLAFDKTSSGVGAIGDATGPLDKLREDVAELRQRLATPVTHFAPFDGIKGTVANIEAAVKLVVGCALVIAATNIVLMFK